MKNNKSILAVMLICILCILPTTAKNPIVGRLLKEAANVASTAKKVHDQQKKIKKNEQEPAKVSTGILSLINESKETTSDTKTETENQLKKETGFVTLTVSSDGPTKEEATKNALRSAIEQAFGTFVSANTTILDDEIVKDEIVTVSNGSIKDYTEISAIKNDEGGYLVTLTATVSLSNLISYAKNHGSECEFAGNTFAMEMKLYELEKENELKALYNLTDQVLLMLPNIMTHYLKVGEPRVPSDSDEGLYDYHNTTSFYPDEKMLVSNSNYRMCIRKNYQKKCPNGTGIYSGYVDPKAEAHIQQFLEKNIEETKRNYYEVPMFLFWNTFNPLDQEANSDPKDYLANEIPLIIRETLDAIAVKTSNIENYNNKGIKLQKLTIPDVKAKKNKYTNKRDDKIICLRNSEEDIKIWILDLSKRIDNLFNSFVILDNTGTESNFYPKYIIEQFMNKRFNSAEYSPIFLDGKKYNSSEHIYREIFGTGIFYNYINDINFNMMEDQSMSLFFPRFYGITDNDSKESNHLYWGFNVWIPRDEIGKYTNFRIEQKNQ